MTKLPTFELPFGSEEAYQKILSACNEVGKVEDSNALAKYVVVKARYGLNPVRARIVVTSVSENLCSVDMQARGQDGWGVASRTVMERIISAIR